MILFAHRRSSKLLGLALCVVWVATLAQADTAMVLAMRCQRHMPCCPQSPNREGCGNGCSEAQCAEQIPEKAEAQEKASANQEQAAAPAIGSAGAGQAGAEPIRELTAGLQFRAGVFRLKDDLRI